MRSGRIATAALAGLLVGLPAALGTGCVSLSSEFGNRIPVEKIADIQDGVTTREEITRWFGPPSAFYNPTLLDVILEDQEDVNAPAPLLNDVYTYRHIQNDSKVFFVPILFAVFDGVAVAETLTVFFDEEGRVEYHAYRRDEPRGSGR